MYTLNIKTNKRNEMIDITNEVQRIISSDNIEDGLAIVYTPHTTTGVTINEGTDPSVKQDIIDILNRLIPENYPRYKHTEENSDAHIKASIIGSSVTIIIKQKKLVLGTWQSIFLYEADGPRNRRVYIETIKKN